MKRKKFMFATGLILVIGSVVALTSIGLLAPMFFGEDIDTLLVASDGSPSMVSVAVLGGAVLIPIIGTLLIVGSILIPLLSGMRENSRILEQGQSAEARILSLSDTGTRINDSPLVDISLEVRPPGAPAFTAQTRQTISVVHLPMYQPGQIVNVRYMPGTSQVAILGARTI